MLLEEVPLILGRQNAGDTFHTLHRDAVEPLDEPIEEIGDPVDQVVRLRRIGARVGDEVRYRAVLLSKLAGAVESDVQVSSRDPITAIGP